MSKEDLTENPGEPRGVCRIKMELIVENRDGEVEASHNGSLAVSRHNLTPDGRANMLKMMFSENAVEKLESMLQEVEASE